MADSTATDSPLRPLRVLLAGAGARSMIYADMALKRPDLMQIAGVAEIDPVRLQIARETFGLDESRCFPSIESMAAAPRFADAAINATMDSQHVRTSLPLLRRGYGLLLEKPFAANGKEADELLQCLRETQQKAMVCHVLRYAPFYRSIKAAVDAGEIGNIIHIEMSEHVSYYHESVSFVRGKFAARASGGSGMLLAKCSHDLDLMAWLMSGNEPAQVSSVGSVFQFKPGQAPPQAGSHCLNDCPLERSCPFSARRLYIENCQRWANNVWHESNQDPQSDADKERILRDPDNPFSRCIYRCNIQIVDHQAILIRFRDGATGSFAMVGGATASARPIRITGTRGEIRGVFEEECYEISHIDPSAPGGRTIRKIDVSPQQKGNPHGGGDQEIVLDFIRLMRGEPISPVCPLISDSVVGCRLAFLAERSRLADGKMLDYEAT